MGVRGAQFPVHMDRLVLGLVTFGSLVVSWVAPGWSWITGIATVLVGVVGFYTTIRADGRAARQEARAVRAEERASRDEERALRAEQRAQEAERREREAHEWGREKRDAEAKQAREREAAASWVADKKREHGTSPFPIDLDNELDLARAAERLGLIRLKELRGDAGLVDVAAWVV